MALRESSASPTISRSGSCARMSRIPDPEQGVVVDDQDPDPLAGLCAPVRAAPVGGPTLVLGHSVSLSVRWDREPDDGTAVRS